MTWSTFLKVKDEATAQRLLSRLEEALGVELEAREVERYWKDHSLYRCTFTTPLPPVGGNRTADVLALAGRVAPGWYVNGLMPDTPISGTATDSIVVSGVTWLSFDLV